MATTEALIKYYDCLKDSFNKIQDKDNSAALLNAALRPKIREEFAKSDEVLYSYLNYIQVFSVIYCDKFSIICSNIIIPLFKEYELGLIKESIVDTSQSDIKPEEKPERRQAVKIHNSIKTVLKSKPELAEDFVHSMTKVFPSAQVDDQEKCRAFIRFLENSIHACTYLEGDNLTTLITKILEKLNYNKMNKEEKESENIENISKEAFQIIRTGFNSLDDNQAQTVGKAFLTSFVREFVSSQNNLHLYHLIFYISSTNEKFVDFFMDLLWTTFTDSQKPHIDRQASLCFASSYLSRAKFVSLEFIFKYLEKAKNWCSDFLDEEAEESFHDPDCPNESVECFYAASQFIFYIITQKYRALYEEESILKLQSLDLDKLISCTYKPLQNCDTSIEQRFHEIAHLYCLADTTAVKQPESVRKRRKSEIKSRPKWQVPYAEKSDNSLPIYIKNSYLDYVDHRRFTVYRE